MRRAIHIYPWRRATKEGVCYLCESAVESQLARNLNRSFSFPAVRPARPLEFKAPVIRDVNLLVGTIDQEEIGGNGHAFQVVRIANLVKVRGWDFRRIRPLHDASSILAGDSAPIVGIKSEGYAIRRSKCHAEFRLKLRCTLDAAVRRIKTIVNGKAEVIETKPGIKMQPLPLQVNGLL